MYPLLRPLLFRLDPEFVHAQTLRLIRLAGMIPPARAILCSLFSTPPQPVEVFGLTFKNRIGLAAGYDKDGIGWRGLACLGFGHIELGTVTPKAQPGNPRPRLFRLAEDRALINRMGFPGKGAPFLARQLQRRRPDGLVLGVNLGKNKDTPLEAATGDYVSLLKIFAPMADYLVINVSSPNTAGLRRLQARQALEELLVQIVEARQALPRTGMGAVTPVLVKLAPDLNDAELDDALEAVINCGLDGVIAANTTVSRDGLRSSLSGEVGGLSGAPLGRCTTEMIRKITLRTNGSLPVIGCGGVMDAATAREKLDAGASLVQVYTGLIYAGPGLVKSILASL